MARVRMLRPEELDPELRELTKADEVTDLQLGATRITGHHPAWAKAYARFGASIKSSGVLSARLRELVRLRIAFHNQCRGCMAIRYRDGLNGGVTEDLVCSLERPQEAPDLTPAERLALEFADRFATNHLSIDDALYANLGEHFTEQEVVELGMWCAFTVGFGRLQATWKMIEGLPGAFADPQSGKLAPWGSEFWVSEIGGTRKEAVSA